MQLIRTLQPLTLSTGAGFSRGEFIQVDKQTADGLVANYLAEKLDALPPHVVKNAAGVVIEYADERPAQEDAPKPPKGKKGSK